MPTIAKAFRDAHAHIEDALGEPVSITGLTRSLRIFQRVQGHRHSLDDAITAWYALRQRPDARQVLDLGTGIGTVGLIVLEGLGEDARMTCIEAQDTSFRLLAANVQCNGLRDRVTAIHGDLRDLALPQRFELVTGSPPYFNPREATLPRDEQKAYARFELRGNVGDYARIARRHLHPDGVFVFCFPYRQKQRGMDLVRQQGFTLSSCLDVIPNRVTLPLFSVFAARLRGDGPMREDEPLIVEGDDGRYSAQMMAIQATRGFGPQGTNVIGDDEGSSPSP